MGFIDNQTSEEISLVESLEGVLEFSVVREVLGCGVEQLQGGWILSEVRIDLSLEVCTRRRGQVCSRDPASYWVCQKG